PSPSLRRCSLCLYHLRVIRVRSCVVPALRGALRLFFSNAPATPDTYTLSLHDALPIYAPLRVAPAVAVAVHGFAYAPADPSRFLSPNCEHGCALTDVALREKRTR